MTYVLKVALSDDSQENFTKQGVKDQNCTSNGPDLYYFIIPVRFESLFSESTCILPFPVTAEPPPATPAAAQIEALLKSKEVDDAAENAGEIFSARKSLCILPCCFVTISVWQCSLGSLLRYVGHPSLSGVDSRHGTFVS
jgi:hypothetical protein